MIMLVSGKTISVVNGLPISRIIRGLEHRYDKKDKHPKWLAFPTNIPHPTKKGMALLVVEIDSVEHGPSGDGSDWVIIGTLSRLGDFWATKPGDSNKNPQVRIAYNSDDQDGVFELHLDS